MAEPTLQSFGDQTRSAFERLETPIWVFDIANERMVWANPPAVALWRAPSLESLLERNFAADMSHETRTRLAGYLERFRRGERVTEDWTFVPEGRAQTVRCVCSGVSVDGDAMMLVEGTVHEGHVFLDALMEHLDVPVLVFNRDGVVNRSNPAAAELAGAAEPALKGSPASALPFGIAWPPPESATLEATVTREGETQRVLWSYFEAAQLNAGDSWVVVIGTDVTARRELEDELATAARLAAIGRLADRFAHEINQPLAYLIPNLEDLLARDAKPETVELLRECLGAALRISGSIEGLIRLARQSDDPHGSFLVSEALSEIRQFGAAETGPVSSELTGRGGRAHFIHALLATVAHHAAAGCRSRIELRDHESDWFVVSVAPDKRVPRAETSADLTIAMRLTVRAGGRLFVDRATQRASLTWPKATQ